MSCSDLLPKSVNLFLDKFETTLCLPILMVIVFCTAQFVFNHVFGIGYMIYQNIRKPIMEKEAQDTKAMNVIGKLKGMLTTLGIRKPDTTNSSSPTIQFQEEEWDYCDEDDY